MPRYEDCHALSEAEIAAIAEHEHIPEIVAAEFGNYLIRREDGVPAIKAIIAGDIVRAKARGDVVQAAALQQVLKTFIEARPAATAG